MVGRVTPGFRVNDFLNNLQRRDKEIQKTENQLSSGYKIQLPSEDPIAAINYMKYDSRLKEIETYGRVINNMDSKMKTIDGKLDGATKVMQRMRELAVQMSNGTYTAEDRQNATLEVDQLLRELVSVGNSYYKGDALFAGTRVEEVPFKVQYTTDPKTGVEFIENVKYIGNNQATMLEVERGVRLPVNQAGNQIFWAENMQILPTMPSTGYTVPMDSRIVVDGIEIQLRKGDNLDTIAGKINSSGAAVHADVMTKNGESTFVMESTSPHQIKLMDIDGGAVFNDLGLIDKGMYPPDNYSANARVYSGSAFDMMVRFRKALQSDDVFKIGGRAIAALDNTLSNVLKFRAHMGAVQSRAHNMLEGFENEKVFVIESKNNSIGTNMAEATMNMKMLEFAHNVALNVGGRMMPKTLLDFLR